MFGYVARDPWLGLLCSVVFALFLALLYVHKKHPGTAPDEDEEDENEDEFGIFGDYWEDDDQDEDAA